MIEGHINWTNSTQDFKTTGIVLVGDGAVGAPSLAFASDPTTGLYSTLNAVNITIGGVQNFTFQSGIMYIKDSLSANFMTISQAGTALTADRSLSFDLNDVSRAFDLSGDLTVEASSIINSDLSTDANWETSGSGTFGSIVTGGTVAATGAITGASFNAILLAQAAPGQWTISDGTKTITVTEDCQIDQNLATTAAPVFATGVVIGNLTLANGSITDSSNAIDFGNENLSTSGTITGGTYYHTGDADTFIAFAADVIIIEAGGSEFIRCNEPFADVLTINNDAVDMDFVVKAVGQAAALFVQGSDGNVGIGTATPNASLEVKGAKPGVVGGFQSGQLQVTGSVTDEFYCAVITGHNAFNGNTQLWYLGNTSSSSHNDIAFINRQNAAMHFYTNNASRMTIDAAGNVGIGTATPTAAIQMGDDKLVAFDTNAGLTASTTQSQGQGALTAQINEISTVANNDDTVTLPTAVTGVEIEIINNGANTLQIFPASGDNLGLGVNTAEELQANERVKFVAYDVTNWAKESTTEIIHAEIHDEDNTDAFVVNDAGGDFHSYHTNGLAAGDLADWAFDAGGAGTSFPIASIADGADSGVDIAVTTTGNHLLAVGDIVSQTNLADAAYVGIFVVKAIISATIYEVAAVFTADGTGTVDQAATLEADAVAAGVYSFAYYISATPAGNNETFDFQLYKDATAITGSKIRRKFGAGGDFGSMSGGGVVSVANGEKISFALSNEDTAANLTIRNLTIVLVRL